MVKVYDGATKTVTIIPGEELAPGMVEANVIGVGHVWIPAAQIRKGQIRHTPLSEAFRESLRQIKKAMDEIYPKTLDEWEEVFRKDADPEGELELWLHIAATY